MTRDALDVLCVTPDRFAQVPQVGTQCRMTWQELATYLSRPTVGAAKDAAGAWSPALYAGGVRRKAQLVHVCALVIDVDAGGDVDVAATLLERYDAVVHETFSSTAEAPRCRIVILLAEPVDARTYETAHAVVRAHLGAHGLAADAGAKDASRLSYAPVRKPGDGYKFRICDGEPLDARAVLAAQPPPPPRVIPRAPVNTDRYVSGALRRAAEAVGLASPGERHSVLCREAYALARLGLSVDTIADALMPGWRAAAGEARQREGERTIRDAVRARRGAA